MLLSKSEETGLVGSLFNFVDDIIAFPFRITGKTFGAIF